MIIIGPKLKEFLPINKKMYVIIKLTCAFVLVKLTLNYRSVVPERL